MVQAFMKASDSGSPPQEIFFFCGTKSFIIVVSSWPYPEQVNCNPQLSLLFLKAVFTTYFCLPVDLIFASLGKTF
jgi:hypothetical protein